jgi:cell division protein FtsX
VSIRIDALTRIIKQAQEELSDAIKKNNGIFDIALECRRKAIFELQEELNILKDVDAFYDSTRH